MNKNLTSLYFPKMSKQDARGMGVPVSQLLRPLCPHPYHKHQGGGLGGPHPVPQHSTQCPAHTVLNKYFLGTKREFINGQQEPEEKKNLRWWGAVLKDNSCLMLSPETPPMAFCRVGSARPPGRPGCGCFLTPTHLQRKPWSCHRRKEADVY